MKLQSRKIQRQNADWSNLPDELLELIVNFLKYNGTDYARFRAVCRKWRNSSPPVSNFLNLDFPREIITSSGRSIHLISYMVCILYPLTQKHYNRNPKHWILSLEEFHKLRMCHPLTDDLIGVKKSPKSINSLDFGYRIVDFGVKLRFAGTVNDVFCCEGPLVPSMYKWKDYPAKTKSILLKNEGIVVVLLLRLKGVLGTFRFNENLKFNEYSSYCLFDDIVDFKGGVCAITPSGDAWLIKDLEREGCPFRQQLNKSSLKLEFTQERIIRKRLAINDGELYMIVRVPCMFVIFKLNEELQEWERLYSLGDKVLFVTYDKCIFVETCYLPGCKGNCILFPKNCFPSIGRGRDWLEDDALFQGTTKPFEIGVFNMGDDSYRLISSYPELSKLCWPPPSWLWLDSCSSKRGFSEEDENTASCGHIGSESSSVNQIITNFLQHRKNGQYAENPSSSLGQKHTTVEDLW